MQCHGGRTTTSARSRNVPSFCVARDQGWSGPVVRLAGELDIATSPKLRACLGDFIGQRVTLDFTDVTFMDSTAIGVLSNATQRGERPSAAERLRSTA
jgi:anti-anti-sigma factor